METNKLDRTGTAAATTLVLWTFAWVATLALARFGPTHVWDGQPAISWAVIALNLAVGVGLVVSYARRVREMDELQRKIATDALAAALGAAWVGGLSYFAATAAGVVSVGIEATYVIPALMVFVAVVYAVTTVVGNLRYR